MNITLLDIARVGYGLVFLCCVALDIKTRPTIFTMMSHKKVPAPWLFFTGALGWMTITSLGLILNLYPAGSALLLAAYIFIANLIFNNFWSLSKEKRDFSFCMFLTHLSACFGLLAIASSY